MHPLRWLPLAAAMSVSLSATATDCNSLRLTHCGLPWPSDEFAVADETSPTGLRLDFSDLVVAPAAIERWGTRMAPAAVMNGRNGFSAISFVLFEIPQDIDPLTLPLDGAEAVIVYDLVTGERVGINAEQSPLTDSIYITDRKPVLQIYPRSRFAFEHRHLAIVTDQLKDRNGAAMAAPAGVVNALAADGDAQYADVRAFLAEHNIPVDSVRAFTTFTVNDEHSVVSPLEQLVARVYETPHGVRNLRITHRQRGPIAVQVSGQLKSTDFRFEDGSLDWSGDTAREEWIDFELYLPIQAKYSAVPLMVYGHGIVAFRQTAEILGIAPGLAERGIATIAIDHPLHGSRAGVGIPGTSIFNIQAPEYIPDLIGMASQSPLDFHALLAATNEVLSRFDPFADPDVRRVPSPEAGERQVLDMDKLYFTGTSMGGVFGTSFIATAPFRASFFQVAGANIGQAFTHTIFFDDLLEFEKMFVGPATDMMVAGALLHHAVDPADGLNMLHLLREPAGNLLERPLYLQYGIRDEVVVPQEPWAIIETLDLPRVGPELITMPFPVRTQETIGDGWGFWQTDTPLADLSGFDRLGGLGDLATHLTFLESAGLDAYFAWADHMVTPLVPFVDTDGDGVAEHIDNCPAVANADQADNDGDGIGDVCDAVADADVDDDGVANDVDNCPTIANADQADNDGDGIGDACDVTLDADGDSILDAVDNCPLVTNLSQLDSDDDGIGDACDADMPPTPNPSPTPTPEPAPVTDPGASSISGGGAFGWMLLMLPLLAWHRRYSRVRR